MPARGYYRCYAEILGTTCQMCGGESRVLGNWHVAPLEAKTYLDDQGILREALPIPPRTRPTFDQRTGVTAAFRQLCFQPIVEFAETCPLCGYRGETLQTDHGGPIFHVAPDSAQAYKTADGQEIRMDEKRENGKEEAIKPVAENKDVKVRETVKHCYNRHAFSTTVGLAGDLRAVGKCVRCGAEVGVNDWIAEASASGRSYHLTPPNPAEWIDRSGTLAVADKAPAPRDPAEPLKRCYNRTIEGTGRCRWCGKQVGTDEWLTDGSGTIYHLTPPNPREWIDRSGVVMLGPYGAHDPATPPPGAPYELPQKPFDFSDEGIKRGLHSYRCYSINYHYTKDEHGAFTACDYCGTIIQRGWSGHKFKPLEHDEDGKAYHITNPDPPAWVMRSLRVVHSEIELADGALDDAADSIEEAKRALARLKGTDGGE